MTFFICKIRRIYKYVVNITEKKYVETKIRLPVALSIKHKHHNKSQLTSDNNLWLEHIWDSENLFETGVVRVNALSGENFPSSTDTNS